MIYFIIGLIGVTIIGTWFLRGQLIQMSTDLRRSQKESHILLKDTEDLAKQSQRDKQILVANDTDLQSIARVLFPGTHPSNSNSSKATRRKNNRSG